MHKTKCILKRILTIIFVSISCLNFVLGQNTVQPILLSVNDGVSQGMIYDLIQNRQGYLWIATKDGLNRYDGYRFKIYNPDAFDTLSIRSGEVRKLFEDNAGRIWIQHLQGIDVYFPASNNFLHISKKDLPIYTGTAEGISPITFAQTPDGKVWITDYNDLWSVDLLSKIDSKSKSSQSHGYSINKISTFADSPDGKNVKTRSAYYSKTNGLLVSTTEGIYRLNPETNRPEIFAMEGYCAKIIGEDDTERLWVKVLRSSANCHFYKRFPEIDDYYANYELLSIDDRAHIRSHMMISSPGIVTIESGKKMWIVQGNTMKSWSCSALIKGESPSVDLNISTSQHHLDGFNFLSLTTDRSGLVWIGTNGYGLLKIDPQPPRFKSYLLGQTQRAFILVNDKNIFSYWMPERLYSDILFSEYTINPWVIWVKPEEANFPIVFDSFGNGWGIPKSGHLFKINAITKDIKYFSWKPNGLINSSNGLLYSVDEQGLLEINPESEIITLHAFPDNYETSHVPFYYLHHLYESSDGTIWIFSFESLISATPKYGGFAYQQFKNIPSSKKSLSNNTILCVVDDPIEPDKYLWIGTKGGGLNRMNKLTGESDHYTTIHGLPDNVIYGILADNHKNIWLSSNKGLARFSVNSKTVKKFTSADGLQHNEFNTGSYLKLKDGFMLFGGVNGVTVFHPDSIQFNTTMPQTSIVGFKVGNNDYSYLPDHKVVLSYNQNFLGFEFSSFDFTNPHQNLYKYQLIPHKVFGDCKEEEWIDLQNQNRVQFANLRSGSYTFKVRGSNNDGVWQQEAAVFNFEIKPPIWASIWAFIFYFMVLLLIILGIYRFQLNRKIEQYEALRLQKMDELKNKFFTNITHEFRTPLTVILGMIRQIKLQPDIYLDKGTQLIESNGKSLLNLINQLLDLSKLETNAVKPHFVKGDLVAYMKDMCEQFSIYSQSKEIELTFSSSDDQIIVDYDPMIIKQILNNLVSNAIKFTGPKGLIEVSLNVNLNDAIQIIVRDTGIGMEAEELAHIFDRFYQVESPNKSLKTGSGIGLAHTLELVKLLGGTISVQSKPEAGTGFYINLPLVSNTLSKAINAASKSEFIEPANSTHEKEYAHSSINDTSASMSILIIEDNPDLIFYLTSLLTSKYKIEIAENGKVGVEKAFQNPPDLIICDIMMPEMDGGQVCEVLKKDSRISHVPIVLLTAKIDVRSRISGLKTGADAYITKPFESEELLVTIENLFNSRKLLRDQMHKMIFQNANVNESDYNIEAPENDDTLKMVLESENEFVQQLKQYILQNMSQSELSMEDLSHHMLMSYQNLYKKLTSLTGLSPLQFVRLLRISTAETLLLTTDKSIAEIAFMVGFSDARYFSRVFTDEIGKSPSSLRKSAKSN